MQPEIDQGEPESDQGEPEPDYGEPEPDQGEPESDQGEPESDQGEPESDQGEPESDQGEPEPSQDQADGQQDEPPAPALDDAPVHAPAAANGVPAAADDDGENLRRLGEAYRAPKPDAENDDARLWAGPPSGGGLIAGSPVRGYEEAGVATIDAPNAPGSWRQPAASPKGPPIRSRATAHTSRFGVRRQGPRQRSVRTGPTRRGSSWAPPRYGDAKRRRLLLFAAVALAIGILIATLLSSGSKTHSNAAVPTAVHTVSLSSTAAASPVVGAAPATRRHTAAARHHRQHHVARPHHLAPKPPGNQGH